ncbi:MAG: hypothetical protein A2Y17_06660 [Clostridiales bacterium GWF2_38_85]|nr:MAG: hypothetical protein A2Y17_06660 [Clostridiales bacterium GWF2_38_85]HBL84896.1 L-alanine-DL-glutamate epimerase [Clostridiales bacterium]
MRIIKTDLDFIREKLLAPFGFKGRYLNELWQPVVKLSTEKYTAVCPSVQSVLWSDADVFASTSPAASNALMLAVTAYALKLIDGIDFNTPKDLQNKILPALAEYAKKLCDFDVKPTFILNSLVSIDFAIWSLYAKEKNASGFDDIIPAHAKKAMSAHNDKLVQIPLISYNVRDESIKEVLYNGASLLKIKIGNCVQPENHDQDMQSMVDWDKKRLLQIHTLADNYTTPYSESGNVLYYLDANGRYDKKSRLMELLNFADRIGALKRIVLLEEPFSLDDTTNVSDLPVTVTSDESAHSLEDVNTRLALGYKAIALKPIAKTLTASFDMAAAAYASGAMCFCADLTVNPMLAEWNKQFAARLKPLKGMNCGCVEVNGDMNYVNWNEMKKMLPQGYGYTEAKNGAFTTDNKFFVDSVKLFNENRYKSLFM